MDKSLLFFSSLLNLSTNNKDTKTGLPTSNYKIQYNVNKYTDNDPYKVSSTEQKSINYIVVNSLQSEGQYINYLGNSTTNDFSQFNNNKDHESDISLKSIISQSKDNPAIKLTAAHFAYLKEFNIFPANRLIVLRRYAGPSPHDIFTYKQPPINTVVGYYNFEKSPLPVTINFNEKQKPFDSSFTDVLQDVIGIDASSIPGMDSSVGQQVTGSNLAQDIFLKIGQKLGITNENVTYGDPDIIYEAMIRDTNPDDIQSGLESNIRIEFETTYVLRDFGGLDSRAMMFDIIANCIHMGTSNSKFFITGTAADRLNKLYSELESGDINGLLNDIIEGLVEILKEITTKIKNAAEGLADAAIKGNAVDYILSGAKSALSGLIKQRYSRYKQQLKGALSALSGMHSAPQHVTIGNPKYPQFMCGNLVLKEAELIAGGELSYDDMFTELTVKYKLESGRAMGAQELTSLYNCAKGRIYDTPESLQSIFIKENSEFKAPAIEKQEQAFRESIQPETVFVQENEPEIIDIPDQTPFSLDNIEQTNDDPNLDDIVLNEENDNELQTLPATLINVTPTATINGF